MPKPMKKTSNKSLNATPKLYMQPSPGSGLTVMVFANWARVNSMLCALNAISFANVDPIVALIIILHGQENPCNASNPFALLRFRSRSIEVDHAAASAGQRVG